MDNALTRIEAVLFDADGVIQRPAQGRKRAWADLLGRTADVDRLVADVFAAEDTALDGRFSFIEALSQILLRWNCRGTLDDALRAWTMLDVDPGVIGVIRTLRQRGIRCYLATNQEPHRAQHMSETFGYKDVFDAEFYSCRLGVAKPDAAYFRAVLNHIRFDRIARCSSTIAGITSTRRVASVSMRPNSPWTPGLARLNRILMTFGLQRG